jgi:septal ring factor EnvC (AmiA/AmiB activator)
LRKSLGKWSFILRIYISDYNSVIADIQGLLGNYPVADLPTQVSSLQSQLTSANAEILSLQTANTAKITALTTTNTSYQTQITSLERQVSSLNAQNTNLQTQLNTSNNQISSLQAIVNLARSTNVANQITVNQTAGQSSWSYPLGQTTLDIWWFRARARRQMVMLW